MAEDDRQDDKDNKEEEEKHGLEEEIEEILRQKGEQPGRARRPARWPSFPSLPGPALAVVRYAVLLAIAAVLLFLSLRVLGLAGLRLAVMALLLFLFFYTLRGFLKGFFRRRLR